MLLQKRRLITDLIAYTADGKDYYIKNWDMHYLTSHNNEFSKPRFIEARNDDDEIVYLNLDYVEKFELLGPSK